MSSEETQPAGAAGRSRQLVRWALEAGFHRAGTARLEPLPHGGALRRWLDRGDQAGMAWMERRLDSRLDPSRIFPGARSALCVALSYAPLAGEEEPGGDLWPGVARYARGVDYHDLMGERLAALAERVAATYPEVEARWYVDTGPILERELAARAGLGAIGKNTCLLHPEAGSYFLLGELFLSIELADGAPVADLCGRCTRCLEACPTGALPEPYRLDSNLCISYWTIEHRGDLPEPVRRMVGKWVFGCDICQEVCPVNAPLDELADGYDEPDLTLPPERAEIDLVGLLQLDREEYVERFRGSPMKRAKLAGLKRNAAVAMGNRRQNRYVPTLAAALADRDGDPTVRRSAAWALGRIGGAAAETALRDATAGAEEGTALAVEIATALERLGA